MDDKKILQQPVNSSSWVYCPIASRSVDIQSILTMKDAATEEAQAFINGKLVLKAYERYRQIRAENPELSQLLTELTPYNVQQLLMPVKDKNLELAEEIIQIGTILKLF